MRAVIAEDLVLLRDGLIRLLDCPRGRSGGGRRRRTVSPRRACSSIDPTLPCSTCDCRRHSPTKGSLAAIEARKQVPGLPVLVLSQYVEPLYARELLSDQHGGVGYLLKDRVMDVSQFVDAVHRVAGGGTVMDPEVVYPAAGQAGQGRAFESAHWPRAGGVGVHGRRALECSGGRWARRLREGSQQAHRQHLHEARSATVRRRQPSGAGRARLPEFLSDRPEGRGNSPGKTGLILHRCAHQSSVSLVV